MFLDLRDQWPPVPPQSPMPDPTQPRVSKRTERILLVAFNLAILVLTSLAGGTIVHVVATALSAWHR